VADVFLIRHSHVDYALSEGITPRNPLSELGRLMAARLAERCEEWDLQYLFVSTMLRAKQTADVISAHFPELPRVDMPEFEEMNLSDLATYPGEHPSEDLRTWKEDHFRFCDVHVWRRVVAGWDKVRCLVDETGLERVAILAHGGSLNVLLRHFQGRGQAPMDDCWFELDWTSVSCLRYLAGDGPGRKWVRWVNDARHIDEFRHLLPQ